MHLCTFTGLVDGGMSAQRDTTLANGNPPKQQVHGGRRVPQRSWPLSVASTTISSHSSTSAPCTRVGLATTGVGVLKRELRPYIAAVPATSSPPPRCAFTSHGCYLQQLAPHAEIHAPALRSTDTIATMMREHLRHRACPPGPQAQACGAPPRTALLACVQSTCRL